MLRPSKLHSYCDSANSGALQMSNAKAMHSKILRRGKRGKGRSVRPSRCMQLPLEAAGGCIALMSGERAGEEREAHSIPSEIDSGGGGISAAAAGGQNEIVTQPPEIKLGRADADGPTQRKGQKARKECRDPLGVLGADLGNKGRTDERTGNGQRLCRSIDRTGRIEWKASSREQYS